MYILPFEYWMLDNIPSLSAMGTMRLFRNIMLVSNEIDLYCGTRFVPTPDSFSLAAADTFFTRRRPLLEVSELRLNGVPLSPGSDFSVFPDSSKIVCHLPLPDNATFSINYIFGYDRIPAVVKHVAIELLKLDADSADSPYNGFQSESWESEYSYNRGSAFHLSPQGIRKNILSRLDQFVVPPLPVTGTPNDVRVRLL